MFEQMIYLKKQIRQLSFIADDCTQGRETGTWPNVMVAQYIKHSFESYGLSKYTNDSYYQPFIIDDNRRGVNIAGIVPSIIPSDKYVVISAHYDHLGVIKGNIYNGADDNASGVTALLNLAEMFGSMRKAKMGPDKNIIFVAFDAKELDMAGSQYFVNNLNIDKKKIICNINIDQIGTILQPIHQSDTNYVIILGENTLQNADRGKLDMCNKFYNLDLDIDYTFYGSKNFTEMCYKLSDQISFYNAKIPALYFTAGFNEHLYKTTDDENIISYPVLKKRTLLIFYLTLTL